MKHRVAVLQMLSSQHLDTNMKRVDAMIREAATRGVEAVFLPENFGALGAVRPRDIGESPVLRELMAVLARDTGLWIFAGTLPSSIRPDGTAVPVPRVRAASFVYDPAGVEVARYDKIHMFDVDVNDSHRHYQESETFEPGSDVVVVDTTIGRVGLSVCYDIRFPELYRRLFDMGAEVITIPSAFTRPTGEAHFEVLVRARAIENFSYVVAACQGGSHDSGRETFGHSMIVDPWGGLICRTGEGEDILVAELDLTRVHEFRRAMPVGKQRRLVP